MRTVAIIPAAGSGIRMNSDVKKQYMSLYGKPLLYWTLKAFEENEIIDDIILSLPLDDIDYCREQIVDASGFKKVSQIIAGGKRRQDSVSNGFFAIKDYCDVVCIHDGVRPLITPEIITKAVRTAKNFGGACVAVRVKDTIKKITDDGFVMRTPIRRYLYAAQTPQAFEYNLFADAVANGKKKGLEATDDSSLVEAIGGRVVIVEGSYENIKITTESDLQFAEKILALRIKEKPSDQSDITE